MAPRKKPVAQDVSLQRQHRAAKVLQRIIPQEDPLADFFDAWDRESTARAADLYGTPDYVLQERRRRAEEIEHAREVTRAQEQERITLRAAAEQQRVGSSGAQPAPPKKRASRRSPDALTSRRHDVIRRLMKQGLTGMDYACAMDEACLHTPSRWQSRGCPPSYEAAFRCVEKKKWQAAMRRERYEVTHPQRRRR
jgi:hypothetical protein